MARQCRALIIIGFLLKTSISNIIESSQKQDVGIFFLHMRKCGGTSVGNYLRNWLKDVGCCGKTESTSCKVAPHWMASSDTPQGWCCDSIHFRENEYQCLSNDFLSLSSQSRPRLFNMQSFIVQPSFPKIISITILRYPIDRIISQWWYHGGPGSILLRDTFNNCQNSLNDSGINQTLSSRTTTKEQQVAYCKRTSWLEVSSISQSHDKGVKWWEESYLNRDDHRKHLFRSLHANYIDNYFVRRLVASSSFRPSPLAMDWRINGCANVKGHISHDSTIHEDNGISKLSSKKSPASNEEEREERIVKDESLQGLGSSTNVTNILKNLRARCNIRGNSLLTCHDLNDAKKVLLSFEAVLVMEWMSDPSSLEYLHLMNKLRSLLGPMASPSFDQSRIGAASSIASASSVATSPPWNSLGRGEEWRQRQAPLSILRRLNKENQLDLDLYRWACEIEQHRAL